MLENTDEGPTVAEMRAMFAMTQDQFAFILQISRTSLANAESGIHPLPKRAIPWFAALLDASPALTWEKRALLVATLDQQITVAHWWRAMFAHADA